VALVVSVADEASLVAAEVSVAAGADVSTGAASVVSELIAVVSLLLFWQAARPATSMTAAIPVTSLRIVTPL
jgi:hypothetical protein